MQQIVAIGLAGLVLWCTSWWIRRLRNRESLSPKRFASIIASGWSLALLLFFFVGLSELFMVQEQFDLVFLGLGIGVLNFILAYVLGWFMHKYIFSRKL
jgi:hypothetical protein